MSYKDNKTILFDFAIDKNVDDFDIYAIRVANENMYDVANVINYLVERIKLADAEIERLEEIEYRYNDLCN